MKLGPPKRVEPTRSLVDQAKPHRYKNAASTDIRETFKKFERLVRMQQPKQTA